MNEASCWLTGNFQKLTVGPPIKLPMSINFFKKYIPIRPIASK